MREALEALTRPVRLLAAGGTISMHGARAVPKLEAKDLIELAPPLAGVPALSQCCGFTRSGLPIGLQIVAPRGSDLALMRAAAGADAVLGFSSRRPPLRAGS